jgi:hypothetical protein
VNLPPIATRGNWPVKIFFLPLHEQGATVPLARLTSTLVIFYSTAHCEGPTPSTSGLGPPRSRNGGAHHRVIGWVFWFVAQFGRTGYLVRLRSRWRLRTSRSRHAEQGGGMLTHKSCRRVSHIPSLRRGTSDGTGGRM